MFDAGGVVRGRRSWRHVAARAGRALSVIEGSLACTPELTAAAVRVLAWEPNMSLPLVEVFAPERVAAFVGATAVGVTANTTPERSWLAPGLPPRAEMVDELGALGCLLTFTRPKVLDPEGLVATLLELAGTAVGHSGRRGAATVPLFVTAVEVAAVRMESTDGLYGHRVFAPQSVGMFTETADRNELWALSQGVAKHLFGARSWCGCPLCRHYSLGKLWEQS